MVEYVMYTACAKFLESEESKKYNVVGMLPEGQMSADKDVASVKGIRPPRGVQVIAWGTLSDETCRSVLRASAAHLHQSSNTGMEGSIRNAAPGYSINPVNLLTAMFIATGQDVASVAESGWAQFTSDYNEETKQLTFSLFFPSLLVGSVGGGTVYPTQKEALEMIGCAGPGKKWALAETVAAFALALDVSTLGSVASNTKAASHQRMTRASKL